LDDNGAAFFLSVLSARTVSVAGDDLTSHQEIEERRVGDDDEDDAEHGASNALPQ